MSAKERLDILKERLDDLFTENQRLKELCDRYEEEHNNEFKKWQEATRRINKAIEYLEESYNETVEGIEGVAKFFNKRNETLLKILKGSDKE